jgi:hypothetical protein
MSAYRAGLVMPTHLVNAAAVASGGHGTFESSLAQECLVASALVVLLLCVWERRRLAFWCWSFYSPRKRDRAATVILAVFQIAVVTLLTSIVPALSRAFGVAATRALGVAFLIAEAVTAGAAAVVGLSQASIVLDDDGLRALLQRAGRSALDGLGERARDAVPDALTRAMRDDVQRPARLQRLRIVLGEHADDATTASLITRNLARSWPALSDDQREIVVEAVSRYVVANRIPPHRLLR